MACTPIKFNGGTAIVCTRGRRKPKLCACRRPAPYLCDYPVTKGKTCDAPLCRTCSTRVAPDTDLCRAHAAMATKEKPTPMHNDDVFAILAKYAEAHDLDAKKLDEFLVALCDRESLALKLSEGARISTSETVRTILDVTELAFTNVKGTRSRVIPIGAGVTGLFGPNDSGKTTAQLAAGWVLGGPNAFKRGLDEKMLRHGAEEMTAQLTFAGDHARTIRRTLATRLIKKGKDAGSTKTERGLLVKLNGHSEDKPAKAQAEIEEYLGADLDFVMQVAFLQQGQIPQLLDADPAERKTAVYQLLGLHIAEETAKKLRAILKRWQEGRDADLVNRAALDRQRAALVEKVKQLPPRDALEKELEKLAPTATAADQATATQRGAIQRRMAEIDADPVMKLIIGGHVDMAQPKADLSRIEKLLRDAVSTADVLRAKYREIHALPAVCPTCKVAGKTCELTPAWKAGELARIQTDGKAAAASVEQLHLQQKQTLELIDSLEKTESVRAANAQRKELLAAERARLVTQLDGLPAGAVPDASAVEAYGWATEKLRELDSLTAQIATLDQQLARIQDDAPTLMSSPWKGEDERQVLAQASAAFGKDGIPLWLARTHIQRVNQIAAEMAAGDRYIFRFGSDLQVEVVDTQRDNAHVVPQLASGSSRERGALVLAAAMSKYQQDLAGIRCELLWIDELPFQDAVNAQAVAATVKRLAQWFPRVVFAASDWDAFQGQFDHEVHLKNELLEHQIETQRAAGSVPLEATTAEVKLHARTHVSSDAPQQRYSCPSCHSGWSDVEGVRCEACLHKHGKVDLDSELAQLEQEIGNGDPGF